MIEAISASCIRLFNRLSDLGVFRRYRIYRQLNFLYKSIHFQAYQMKFMHRDAYQTLTLSNCQTVNPQLPGYLDQKHIDSSARHIKAALFCTPGLKANANTLQNHNHPHVNCLPFLMSKKQEAVQKEEAVFLWMNCVTYNIPALLVK